MNKENQNSNLFNNAVYKNVTATIVMIPFMKKKYNL